MPGDRLTLKAGPATEPRFLAAGSQPFRYSRGGREVAVGYWEVPEALRASTAEASALAGPSALR